MAPAKTALSRDNHKPVDEACVCGFMDLPYMPEYADSRQADDGQGALNLLAPF